MKKGMIDFWVFIGVLIALMTFLMLSGILEIAQNSIKPSLVPGLAIIFMRGRK